MSYSHADEATARWLHRALESYRLPRALVNAPSPFGPLPRRLPPIFRDRDELPASGDLGHELRLALAESRFQIVLCSPRAATSRWVNEEVVTFKQIHGDGKSLALIIAGEPYSGGATECFPAALRFRLGSANSLSDVPAEPIAADIRPGKDGRRLALLKLIAGLTGLQLDTLVRRDAARRHRRLLFVTAASLAAATITIGLAIYAEAQRRVAESQRRLADRSLEFLIGTFSIANPATENPRTISALTILDRVSRRAGAELKGEPAVSARLLRTTGEIYFNLGLPKEAERTLRAAIALEPAKSEGRARAYIRLASLAYQRGDVSATRTAIDLAAQAQDSGTANGAELAAQIAERRAMVDVLRGRHQEAADGLRDTAARYQALKGDFRQELGRVWINQARSLVKLRRFAEADALFARASSAYAAKFGTSHVLTADAMRNQAFADFEAGRLPEAERGIERAAAIYNRVLEGDHPTIGTAMILTGRIRTARGDGDGALAAFAVARGIFARLYGPRNAAVGDVDFYAAEAAAVDGDAADALRRLANAKSIYDASYGPDDPDQVELLKLRARVLAGANRSAEARRACAAAVTLQAKLEPLGAGLASTRDLCASIASPKPAT